MGPKRKRDWSSSSPAQAPKKKKKTKKPKDTTKEEEEDEGPYYKAITILEEDDYNYLIEWDDGPNGEKYSPSWHPKGDASAGLTEEWEDKKKEARAARLSKDKEDNGAVVGPANTAIQKPLQTGTGKGNKKGRGRPRKSAIVIESSPEPEEDTPPKSIRETPTALDRNSTKRRRKRSSRFVVPDSSLEFETAENPRESLPLPRSPLQPEPGARAQEQEQNQEKLGQERRNQERQDQEKQYQERQYQERQDQERQEQERQEYDKEERQKHDQERDQFMPSPEDSTVDVENQLPEIPDSSPEKQKQDSTEEQQEPGAEQSDQDLEINTVIDETPPPSVQILVTQRSAYEDNDDNDINDGSFQSSQIISGTQNENENENENEQTSSPEPAQSNPVDAAAAPNLTQAHSQYQPEDTSFDTTDSVVITSSSSVHTFRTSYGNTSSARITSSSGVHTFLTPPQFPNGAIIPDSQSLNNSLDYIPSQDKSEESSKQSELLEESSRQDDQTTQPPAQAALIPYTPLQIESQIIPESSVAQQLKPLDIDNASKDNTTQSGDKEEASIQEIDQPPISIEDVAEGVGSPIPPESSAPVSSIPSPPPAQSLDQSEFISQSQSQALQSLIDSEKQHSIEQAAQQCDLVEFDTSSSIVVAATSPQQISIPGGSTDTGVESIRNGVETQVVISTQSPHSEQVNTPSSIRFNTQVFPHSVLRYDTANQTVVTREQPSSTRPGASSNHPSSSVAVPSAAAGVVRPSSLPRLSEGREKFHADRHSLTSSPIPSVPSQQPGTLGTSAPLLPRANLSSIPRTPEPMLSGQSRSTPGTPLSSKQRVMEAFNAKRAAARAAAMGTSSKPASAVPARLQDRETRSPSMIPAVEVVANEAPEDSFRLERYETLLPDDELEPQEPNSTTMFETLEAAPTTTNLRNIRYIPISFGEMQRDHYKQTVLHRKDLIEEFTSRVWPADSNPAREARKLIEELYSIVLHPDLVNEETHTQSSQVEPNLLAQWDSDASIKFRFLKHFLAASQKYGLRTVILVHPGRIVNKLRTFLKGLSVEEPAVTILTTDQEEVPEMRSPDLILSLQGNISDKAISGVQTRLSQGSEPIPAFALIVPKSVEHIERSMPEYGSEDERLHVLIGTITALRGEAGRARGGSDALEQAATYLVDFCLNPTEWSLQDLPDFRFFDAVTASQASTQSRAEKSNEDSPVTNGTKRTLDHLEVQQSAKKTKTGYPSLEIGTLQEYEASYISDSVASQQAMKVLKEEFARKEKEMEAALQKAQGQLREHVAALEILQFDHEEQRNTLIRVQSERDNLILAAERVASRLTTLEARVNEMRAERSDLLEQLRIAKADLLVHTIPERAEVERLKEALKTAMSESSKLANKVKQGDENLEYLREQYQTASNTAVQLGKANSAFEIQVSDLEKKAFGEQLKLREKTLDTRTKNLENRVRQLELTLKSRNELILNKEDEINRLKDNRGRMNTRGSSVPRTPRLGSPLAQGTSSRQGSPALGSRPHPLRNVG